MNQGSVWRVNLDPAIGAEIKKSRPCVIVNSNRVGKLPLKIVAPLTDFKRHYEKVPWMVVVRPTMKNSLTKTSVIDLFQVRAMETIKYTNATGLFTCFLRCGNRHIFQYAPIATP